MKEECQMIATECCGTIFQGERECNELQDIQGSEVSRPCKEDCRKGVREKIAGKLLARPNQYAGAQIRPTLSFPNVKQKTKKRECDHSILISVFGCSAP